MAMNPELKTQNQTEAKTPTHEAAAEVERRVARWLVERMAVYITQDVIEDIAKEVLGKERVDDEVMDVVYKVAERMHVLYDGVYSEEKVYLLLPRSAVRRDEDRLGETLDIVRAVMEVAFGVVDDDVLDEIIVRLLYDRHAGAFEHGEPRAWYHAHLILNYGIEDEVVGSYYRVGDVWVRIEESRCIKTRWGTNAGAWICHIYDYADGEQVEAIRPEGE